MAQGENFLSSLIQMLSGNAQPRPDIITPGSTGTLENVRPYTFAGRVANAGSGETPEQILKRLPMGDNEEGQGLFAGGIEALKQFMPQLAAGAASKLGPTLAAGLKVFKPGPAREPARNIGGKLFYSGPQIAEIAKPGTLTQALPHQMWPAWINETTGEVRHAMQPVPAGWHEPNRPMAFDPKTKTLVPDPNWVTGHVDPLSWKAFPEKMLDESRRLGQLQTGSQGGRATGGVGQWR